jgi:RHS repeat-associated protein
VVRSSNFQTYGSDGQVSEYPKFSGPLNANWFHCIEVEWPAPHVWVTRETRNRSLLGPVGWMGTLIDGMRDLSGQMYMRNRYYDPASGRFTQEDPIGLAGGLNVYAFGYGDPVSYDDPYGLCAEAAGDSTPKRSSNTCTPEDARWQNVMAGDHVKSEGIGPLIFLLPGAPEAKGVEELGGALIGVTGKIGEAALRQLGGESQVFFRTSIGARFVDQVVNGVGHESKVGAASLTRFVSRQIAKDAELLRTGQLNEIVALFPEPSHGTHRAEPPAGNGTPTGRNSRCASLRRKRAELPSNCAAVHNALSGDVRA